MADTTDCIRDDCLNNEEMRKIFVGGIPTDSTDEELKALFEGACCGTVSELMIIRKGDKKGVFGFVTFESSELVDEVLLQRGSLKVNGKELEVNRAVPKNNTWVGAHEKTKKLFIANLPKGCTEDELTAYFEARHPKKYGCIESIRLVKKKNDDGSPTDENKGYGFVEVSSEDMADKMSIQHSTFQFGGRKIELKKSVANASGEGQRGRGRGRGDPKGAMRGRGGGQFQSYGGDYGGGYGGGYGGDWGQSYGGDSYGYNNGYDNGYNNSFGYQPRGGRGGARGRGGRGGQRFVPY